MLSIPLTEDRELWIGHTWYRKGIAFQFRDGGVIYTMSYFRNLEEAERCVRVLADLGQFDAEKAVRFLREDHQGWEAKQEAKKQELARSR